MKRAILLMVTGLLAMGCPKRVETPKRVEIYGITNAPPARTAQITNSDTVHRIVIARGVALAITSWTTCPDSPPTSLLATDPNVLGHRKVWRNGLANQFVIWGQQAGTTTLTVMNGCTEQKYDVTVPGE